MMTASVGSTNVEPLPARRAVAKPAIRTAVATSSHPNFRDHGRTVDAALLRVIGNLQRQHGQAYASEASLRRMVCEDTGHMPGVDTIRRALERLERQGIVEQHWLLPGGILPDGKVCTHGTRLVVVPRCRRDARGMAARARRREGVTNRVQHRMRETLDAARASVVRQLEAPSQAATFEQRRADALASLEALAATWESEPKALRPPG